MRVKSSSILINLFLLQCVVILCYSSQDFDFFYFVQQWPVSYCDSRQSCCYPTTGKPAQDFSIHGLWPNYNNGKYPTNCKSGSTIDRSEVTTIYNSESVAHIQDDISDIIGQMQRDWPTLACPSANGMKFWDHEWEKHGTCTALDQHSYFKSALDLKNKSNLLRVLENAGIFPGDFYSLESIKQAMKEGVGHEAYIECNVDPQGNHQLYQVYLCVDTSASNFIDCPVLPHGRACGSNIEFPSFDDQGPSSNSLQSKDEL